MDYLSLGKCKSKTYSRLQTMKLGDRLEKLISIITFNQGKKIATYIAKLLGKEDCGCERRKEKLNNL
jgi:hypothetical protein